MTKLYHIYDEQRIVNSNNAKVHFLTRDNYQILKKRAYNSKHYKSKFYHLTITYDSIAKLLNYDNYYQMVYYYAVECKNSFELIDYNKLKRYIESLELPKVHYKKLNKSYPIKIRAIMTAIKRIRMNARNSRVPTYKELKKSVNGKIIAFLIENKILVPIPFNPSMYAINRKFLAAEEVIQ